VPVDPEELSKLSARELLQQGTALLHANRVEDGSLVIFTLCERFSAADESVPPHVLSLYALCLARQGKRKEAVETGRAAIRRDSRSATCRLHMAKIYLLADSRRKAVEEISAGLTSSPNHPELLKLRKEMGVRRRPVIGFLSRDNPLNVKLGKARAAKKNTT
jgi:predicted Zn-dependent protease